MTTTVNTWAIVGGKFRRISDAEANERYFSPANGVYDEAFDDARRNHIARVTEKHNGLRPDD